MSAIVLIDTSVLLNLLDVPYNNQHHQEIVQEFLNKHIPNGNHLLLPMATVLETGNHIADLRDGSHRRKYGHLFVDQIKKALHDEAPWKIIPFPTSLEVLRSCLAKVYLHFPRVNFNIAMRIMFSDVAIKVSTSFANLL